MVNNDLTTFTRILRSFFFTKKSLKFLIQTHSSITLIIVLHLHISVLSNLQHYSYINTSNTRVSELEISNSGKASLIAFLKRETTVEIKELPSAIVAIVTYCYLRNTNH